MSPDIFYKLQFITATVIICLYALKNFFISSKLKKQSSSLGTEVKWRGRMHEVWPWELASTWQMRPSLWAGIWMFGRERKQRRSHLSCSQWGLIKPGKDAWLDFKISFWVLLKIFCLLTIEELFKPRFGNHLRIFIYIWD